MGTRRTSIAALATGLALALTVSACGGGAGGGAPTDVAAPELAGSAELDALVAAAQEEDCLTLYGVPDESALQGVTDAFTQEYGIDVSFVRLVSADLAQRYSTEAGAGAPAADLILLTHSPFYADALDRGWLTPVDEAGLPAYSGEFPAEYTADDGATPIVQLVPTTLVYNPGLVDTPPSSWEDYADPAYRGELLFAGPRTSPANVAFWQLMRDTYGDDMLRGVAANEPRWHNSAVPATQGVAAGEGAIGFPGVLPIVADLQRAGAPVESAAPTPTTGPEIGLGLTANGPCSDAARLFANYVLSEPGSVFLNDLTGDISPYSAGVSDFVRPEPVSEAQAQEIADLLGAP
ncbi:ABC transporter substrate-binding protein [Pseudonocardia sp. ICBG1293]|uniref:ABC transporter substrate-binding protein n=1 Tax=Pseudonocardia sp. ICBG1293 TaxID=2844382 RepID=UPI001CCCF7F3|nr:extracellular solute-binding protein [Pseudonocardia sp. ICBG1293]